MSSTNRGTQRNADDYYVTPHWLIEDFLAAFAENNILVCSPDENPRVLDPSAGGCEKYPMSYPTVLEKHGFNVNSWDIREDSRAKDKCIDFLAVKPFAPYDMIITNPPFNKAQEFTEHALEMVFDGGLVIMLQRLNWLGSQKRKPMWQSLPLAAVYVHSKRPGFDPEKPSKTDSTEYAHFVFCKGYENAPELFVI
ncbi:MULTISPECIES: SAM-dependent DNA methyltransferase [unclassified Pseudoalteromonas]|uniref:SAM-dependent DNA methyltransferase n=1 Tax=unclassified Pseudoalteromonas TaxID=194690 RepID=UPI0016014058|nr:MULTISPECIES: SAM-dependent DNA methyltransferase [unclassified Pseudoalteromonas]MBB1333886.1 SAM-dependent DNA methyltransferase [Pseudoalteromonas sp. SR41-6]MBB1459607.1 SAM-dependent DNA methyltransferase [Pseudoalteromonas sp. SG41-8]